MNGKRRVLRIALVWIVSAAACAGVPAEEDLESRLLEADRAFQQASIERGLDGWMSFFTEDAVRVDLRGGTAVGLAEIREADAPLFEPGGVRLRWEPQTAVAFAGGVQGMTRGRYTVIRPVDEGEPEVLGGGTYLTLWRLEEGRLKVYLDTGAPDPPPEKLLD